MNVIDAILNFLSRLGNKQEITIMESIAETGFNKFNVKPGGFKPSWIVIHHSFSADNATKNWDSIRAYHMSYRYKGDTITKEAYDAHLAKGKTAGLELPWKDVGYHFGVENLNGKLVALPGRAIGEIGAHAHGFNDKSVGICLIGNYDIDAPSEDRLFLVASLCRQLQLEFGIPRDQVIGHRETYGKLNPPVPPQKTCPGSMFDLDKFRARLRD